jgi:hypothetical protein
MLSVPFREREREMRRTVFLALVVMSSAAAAQSTIYKHIDANGHVTYTNKPMKDAVAVELEPITTIPSSPDGRLVPQGGRAEPVKTAKAAPAPKAGKDSAAAPKDNAAGADDEAKPDLKPAVAIVTALPSPSTASFTSVEPGTQKRRDEARRRILEDELKLEEEQLETVRKTMVDERQNPVLVAAVRSAQSVTDPTPAQQLELRQQLDKASGRIRGLQATAAEHEKNIEALKKELGSLKP